MPLILRNINKQSASNIHSKLVLLIKSRPKVCKIVVEISTCTKYDNSKSYLYTATVNLDETIEIGINYRTANIYICVVKIELI